MPRCFASRFTMKRGIDGPSSSAASGSGRPHRPSRRLRTQLSHVEDGPTDLVGIASVGIESPDKLMQYVDENFF